MGRVREMWIRIHWQEKTNQASCGEAGNFKANVVGRREVVRDEASLREEAGDHFDRFWEGEKSYGLTERRVTADRLNHQSGLRRIYVASYVKGAIWPK